MYTLKQANELQEDFAYIIDCEQQIGMETALGNITLFFKHGGAIKESYNSMIISATMPTNKRYLALKAKYFPDINSLSIFYPTRYKKYLDNTQEV